MFTKKDKYSLLQSEVALSRGRATEGTGVLAVKQAPRRAQGALLSSLLGLGQGQAMIGERRQLPPGLVRLQ